MKGTVQSVGGGLLGVARSITVARKDAPAAQLHVAEQTRITLDDRAAKLSDLREGDEVRALFDFDESRPVALQIEAKKASR
jgi:Cu/Ag efflux protein CusF